MPYDTLLHTHTFWWHPQLRGHAAAAARLKPPLPALLFSEVNAFAAFLQMIKWLLRSPIQNKLKGIQVQKHPVISVCSQWNNYPEGFALLNIQKVIDNLPVHTTSSSSVEGPFPTPYQCTCAACHEQTQPVTSTKGIFPLRSMIIPTAKSFWRTKIMCNANLTSNQVCDQTCFLVKTL